VNDLPQNTLVKVTFRCDAQDKFKMQNSDCILHISVGQEYHEGEKFLATMDLVNRTFRSCSIMLCDTLQRHTLRMKNPNLSDEELYNKSLVLGDEWLSRNYNAYAYLSIDSKVMRWDEWLNHTDYAKYKKEIDNLYNYDSDYRDKVRSTINKFLARQDLLHDETAFKLCETYILEECPILVPIWAQTGCPFIIYPRFRTDAMSATYQHFVGDSNQNVLREVALKFNKRIVPKKLSFSYVKTEQYNYCVN
jgi:tRNA-dependent cyclodipeptide synthase